MPAAGDVGHDRLRLRLVRLAQVAIELQDVGDVLRGLVAGAVTADDEVLAGTLVVGIGCDFNGMRLRGGCYRGEYSGELRVSMLLEWPKQ